uniref:Synaptogyrin 1 n=1 Tax=Suricata suricatta TaxID=37032 RepID=A0A673U9J4_SURSU
FTPPSTCQGLGNEEVGDQGQDPRLNRGVGGTRQACASVRRSQPRGPGGGGSAGSSRFWEAGSSSRGILVSGPRKTSQHLAGGLVGSNLWSEGLVLPKAEEESDCPFLHRVTLSKWPPFWTSPLKCLFSTSLAAAGGEEDSLGGGRPRGVVSLSPGLVLGGELPGSHACPPRPTPPLPPQVFSIVVFGSIVNEGYLNNNSGGEKFCIYNRNPNACSYGVAVGVLAFLTCLLYLALDVYFPQISSVKDRKKAVLSDIGVSAFWAFLWFVGFCFLANQWQVSKPKDNPMNEGTDAARAAITFSFFSIFTWSLTAALAVRRFKDLTFQEEYSTLFPASAQP